LAKDRRAENTVIPSDERVRIRDKTSNIDKIAVRAIRWKNAWVFLLIGILLVFLAGWCFWYYVSPDLKRSPTFSNDIVIGTSRSVYVLRVDCEFGFYSFNRAFDIYCHLNIEGIGTFYLVVTVPFGTEAWEPKGGRAAWSVPINASYYSVAVAELVVSEPHEAADANVRLILKDSFVHGHRGNYQVTIPLGFRSPYGLLEELAKRYEGYASGVNGKFDISLDLPLGGEITRVYPPDYEPTFAATLEYQRLEWTITRLAPILVSYSMGAEATSYQVALFGSGLLFGTALSMITSSLRDIATILGIRALEREARRREPDSSEECR
jgi:hypothetical protein